MMSNAPVADFGSEKASSATWALCWKQWHELLAPMAMLTMGSLVMLTVFGFLSFDNRDFFGVMAGVPVTMSICFTFACCFVSFVSEKESRTSSFLVNLPLSSVHVGVVKILMVIVAVLIFCMGQALMAGIGTLIKWQVDFVPNDFVANSRWDKGIVELTQTAQVIPLFIAVTLVVGLFSCSLWSRSWISVLMAVIWGSWTAIACSMSDTHYHNPQELQLSASAIWGVRASLALLVVGAVWFPLRWLRQRPSRLAYRLSGAFDHLKFNFARTEAAKSRQSTWAFFSLPHGGRFGALVWQSVHQQSLVLMFCSFFLTSIAFCLLGLVANPTSGFFQHLPRTLALSFSLSGLVAGGLTLHHDKKNNNLEFFQQHREHGIALMIARIIPPIALLLVLAGIAWAYKTEMAWRLFIGSGRAEWINFERLILLSGLTFYSAVLLCSMIFRSNVYALGVGLVVAMVGTITGGAMGETIFTDGPFSWMLALPFVWLASSVAYGPRWLSGRHSWAWTAYFTVILLCAFTVPIYLLACWLLGIEPDASLSFNP